MLLGELFLQPMEEGARRSKAKMVLAQVWQNIWTLKKRRLRFEHATHRYKTAHRGLKSDLISLGHANGPTRRRYILLLILHEANDPMYEISVTVAK